MTIRTVSPEVFAAMKATATNQGAWEIFVDSLVDEDPPQFIGGFDCADWKDNHVVFQDRGVAGRGRNDIKVQSS